MKDPDARIVVGLDGGGSRSRALVIDTEGEALGRAEGPPGLVDPRRPEGSAGAVRETVEAALAEAGVSPPVEALWAGLAGAGREETRQPVEAAIAALGLAERVRVGNDAEAAFHDAFGDGPGILLLAGTGSVARGRGEDGSEARVGGWGVLLGDEGSGYGLGLQALRAVARAVDGRIPGTGLAPRILTRIGLEEVEDLISWGAVATKGEVATLAPVVQQAAEEGDAVAEAILHEAATHLRGHVMALLDRLGPWSEPPGVALVGGTLEPDGILEARVRESLAGLECRVLDREVDGVRGAARLALRLSAAEVRDGGTASGGATST